MTNEHAEQETALLEDFTAVEEGSSGEEWTRLMRAMGTGKTILVSESVAMYFLEVLPPHWMGRGGAFAFCEGDDKYTVFVAVRGQWLMRTLPYGERAPAVLEDRARDMATVYARHLSQTQAEDGQEFPPES